MRVSGNEIRNHANLIWGIAELLRGDYKQADLGDRRLDAEGCHLGALEWHVQVDEHSGDQGAERLEVVPTIDENHPTDPSAPVRRG